MKNHIVLIVVLGVLMNSESMMAKPQATGKRGSVQTATEIASKKESAATSKLDKLVYLGRDTDLTGPDSKPDGQNDSHLQLVHTFKKGLRLYRVDAAWYANPDQKELGATGWISNSEKWRAIIHADGKPLNDQDPSMEKSGMLEGRVRLDIYTPYNDVRFESKGSSYHIILKIFDSDGKLTEVSASTVLK